MENGSDGESQPYCCSTIISDKSLLYGFLKISFLASAIKPRAPCALFFLRFYQKKSGACQQNAIAADY